MDGFDLTQLRFYESGLIPAIVQDVESGQLLMLAYMNKESLRLTLETGLTHFYSRSRQRDRKSTRLNSSHSDRSRMPSSA